MVQRKFLAILWLERMVTPNDIFNHFQSWYVEYGTNIFPRWKQQEYVDYISKCL